LSQLIQRMQQQWRPDWSRAQRASLDEWQRRLNISAEQLLQQSQNKLAQFAQSLQHISPLATLARGYAVAMNAEGKALTSAAQVSENDSIKIRLHDGQLSAVVTMKDKT
jgi:exodeoxyribonuclease VII large subunit